MDNQLLIVLLCFGAAALLAYLGFQFFFIRAEDGKLRSRLTGRGRDTKAAVKKKAQFKDVLQQLGQRVGQPFMPKDTQKQQVIRRNLARAGIYTPSGMRTVTGAKIIFLGIGLVVGYVFGTRMDQVMLMVALGGIVGYMAPMLWLRFKTNSNQRELSNALPDALDLMVVCVEAGMTVDAAMQRVGQELALPHPALSRELGMTHMETRVGLSRSQALRNLGQRTGNASLQSLAAMLIQADRFGTSIADALRVHSESMRVARQMAAEEMAGKASVKMSFPLVLCIFPATFIVLAGPTIIQLMESSLFK